MAGLVVGVPVANVVVRDMTTAYYLDQQVAQDRHENSGSPSPAEGHAGPLKAKQRLKRLGLLAGLTVQQHPIEKGDRQFHLAHGAVMQPPEQQAHQQSQNGIDDRTAQEGFPAVADVGFDLYMRMVGEAVNDYKTGIIETEEISHECKIEIPVDAHLPEEYVDSERLRLDIYRRLADVKDPIEIKPIEEELIDRFGPLPEPVVALIQVATLRASARKLGIQEMIQQGKNLRISPIKLPESKQLKMQRIYPGSMYKGATNVALIALPAQEWSPLGEKTKLRDTSVIAWATSVLQELTGK